MTDLSMILFMITAAAVNEAPAAPAPTRPSKAPVAPPALGEPIAVWRGGPGVPGLGQWLAAQPADPRQRLTVVGSARNAAEALQLAARAGRPARIVLEPDGEGAPYATLTYDQGEELARPLQPDTQSSLAKDSRP